jgi:hypothetical protein
VPVHLAWRIALALLAAAPCDRPAITTFERVRAASTETRTLIEASSRGSATVRALLTRLAATDAIVYVEMTGSPQIPTGRTKLVTAVAGTRFIRIGLNTAVAFADRGPLLAHELQHAVEIAERAEVRDDAAVRALYRRIGRARGGDAFETDAAQGVEFDVRSELRTKMGG